MVNLPEAAILSSGSHKAEKIKPYLRNAGVAAYHVPVPNDLPERESVSPRKILPYKLKEFSDLARPTILWQKEFMEKIPHALIVLDVLGLKVDNPGQSFGKARDIYKKPTDPDAIRAAARHFYQMGNQPLIDGHYWAAKIPGAAIAPVDLRTGMIKQEQTKSRWDQPLYYGFSPALIELLSTKESIGNLIEKGLVDRKAFTTRSIGGVKDELLISSIIPLAILRPNDGISMAFNYRGKDWKLDAESDWKKMEDLFVLVDAMSANASKFLADQLANDVFRFAGVAE